MAMRPPRYLVPIVLASLAAIGQTIRADDSPSLTRSARPLTSRHYEELLATFRSRVVEADFDHAADALQSLLDAPPEMAVRDVDAPSGSFVGVTSFARRLLQTGGPQLLAAYRKRAESLAQRVSRELQRPSKRAEIARRFPATSTWSKSVRYLGRRAFDVGRFHLAVRSFDLLATSSETVSPVAKASVERLERFRRKSPNQPDQVPSVEPQWHRGRGLAGDLAESVDDVIARLEGDGLPRFMEAVPLCVDQHIYVRSASRLTCYDISTGDAVWSRENIAPKGTGGAGPTLLANPGFRRMMVDGSLRRLQMDSVIPSLSADHRRLFCIEDRRANAGNSDLTEAGNVLASYVLIDGRPAWRLDRSRLRTELPRADDWRESVTFLGAPLVAERCLFQVALCGAQVRALAINPDDGHVLWWLPLVDADSRIASAVAWRGVACRPVLQRGLLICPTACGAIGAVDVLTRSLVWVRQYDVRGAVPLVGQPARPADRISRPQWISGWRSVALLPRKSGVILASPESASLYCLDGQTGRSRWMARSDQGLFVADADDHRVLYGTANTLTSRLVADGKVEWTTEFDGIVGRGFRNGSNYVVPVTRGVAVVNVEQGDVRRTFPSFAHPGGSLSLTPAGVIALTERGVSRLWGINERLLDVSERADSDTASFDDRLALARIAQESGDFDRAANTLRELTKTADPQQRPAIQNQLHGVLLDTLHANPSVWREHADELRSLSADSMGEWHVSRSLARAASRSGDHVEALELYLSLLDDRRPGFDERRAEGRRVLRSRQLQGEIEDLLASVEGPARVRLEGVLEREWKRALESADPFAAQRFALQLGGLNDGLRFAVSRLEETSIGVGFLQRQLRLLIAAGATAADVRAVALWELADQMKQRRFLPAVRAYLRELTTMPADVRLPDGRVAAHVAREQLAVEAGSVSWPMAAPTVTKADRGNGAARRLPIQIDASRSSLLDRLDVSIDERARRLFFQGDDYPDTWGLDLPSTKSGYRLFFRLHHGWAIGQLLILQLGHELFAIAPIDDAGEPRASVLWTRDLLPEIGPVGHQYRFHVNPARKGFTGPTIHFVDRFARPAAVVSPVRPGYLTVRTGGRLRAIDPFTGAELWTRHGLRRDARVYGDDAQITIWDAETHTVEVIRPIDGRRVDTVAAAWDHESVVAVHNTTAILFEVTDNGATLSTRDLVTGDIGWTRTLKGPAVPFAADPGRIGLVWENEDGRCLTLLHVATGDSSTPVSIDAGVDVDDVLTNVDSERIYVLLATPVDDPKWLSVEQVRGGAHAPLGRGQLLALDRDSMVKLWQRDVPPIAFPLVIARQGPLWVTSFLRPGDTETAKPYGALFCLDKRTGEIVLEEADANLRGYWTVQANVDRGRVEIVTTRRRYVFDFRRSP